MQGRTPTKPEIIYIKAAKRIGCVACRIEGRDTEGLDDYTAFHHNPDKGSVKQYAHMFGYGLCAYHHQGVIPPGVEDPQEGVRHKDYAFFTVKYGNDMQCAAYVWERLNNDEQDCIGMSTGIYSFDDLLRLDANERNQKD